MSYFINESMFWPAQWVPAPPDFRGRSIELGPCPKNCPCCNRPTMQLAVVRAIRAADRERAQRDGDLWVARQQAREARRMAAQ